MSQATNKNYLIQQADRTAFLSGTDGGGNWYYANLDADGNLRTRNLIWNTSTLAWEAATGSLAGGSNVTVNNFPAVYPVNDNGGSLTVDATSWPLPTGAATDAGLAAILAELSQKTEPANTQIVDVTDKPARDLGKVDIASLDQYTPISGRLPVDGSGVTQPVSITSSVLPTGAATEVTLLTKVKSTDMLEMYNLLSDIKTCLHNIDFKIGYMSDINSR